MKQDESNKKKRTLAFLLASELTQDDIEIVSGGEAHQTSYVVGGGGCTSGNCGGHIEWKQDW